MFKLTKRAVDGLAVEATDYFAWDRDLRGFGLRVRYSDAAYFSPSIKSDRRRRSGCWKPHPSPQQVHHVLGKMPIDTVFQRRDRALLAFLFLNGSRESAAISIRLSQVDLSANCVHFDGRRVDTKFGKSFSTGFFPVGDDVVGILSDWIGELRSNLFFAASDPLFPKTQVGIGSSRHFEALGLMREPWANPSQAAKIFKSAFVSAGFPP